MTASIRSAFERLDDAARTGTVCRPVRDLIGSSDLAAAYAVQVLHREQALASGRRRSGRKIGLTSPAVQRQLGVDQPDFGDLFADTDCSGALVPMATLLQPRVEAEIAFVLGADLAGDITESSVRAAVDHAVAALEIVDSRIQNWDISIADTIADNASSGRYLLGSTQVALSDFEPRDVRMKMQIDGHLVATGSGTECLGDPLLALAWLARAAIRCDDPLRAGEVVLSGALGPLVTLQYGMRVTAEISGLGLVTAVCDERTR